MSIFSIPPPSFTKSDAKKIVYDVYGLIVKARTLDSDRDQNFYLYNKEKEFVLKIYNPKESIDIINMQTNVLHHFQEISSDLVEAPRIINTLGGKRIGRVKRNNTEYVLRLVSFLNGPQLKDIDEKTISYYQLGTFIGNLTKALESFSNAHAKRIFPWDINNIDFLNKHSTLFKVEKEESIISHFIKEFEKNILPNKNLLRKSIIHNDCNDHNIIVNNNEIYGIIDFGDMVYTYVAAEPAVCIAYAVLGRGDSLSIAGDIIKGFCLTSYLSSEEIKAIIYLVCIRLCISVTMAKYRSEIFPENKYLMVSNIEAWEFLYFMYQEDLETWSKRLAQYVRP